MAISLSDVIAQNTPGKSQGLPVGVPTSWGWYNGLYKPAGHSAPPPNFTSVTGWAAVYQKDGAPAYTNPNARVEVANAKTYIHLKSGEWVLVENQQQTQMVGAHFINNLSGPTLPMQGTVLPNGGTSFAAPPTGFNDHFWFNERGTYAAGSVDAVYVQMDMRVTDPNLNLLAIVGADWWRNVGAPFVNDHSNNPTAGNGNWVQLSTQWTTLGFYSTTSAQFQADLPPPLAGAVNEPDIKPTILSYTTDSGVVGDRITNDSTLTLSGKATAGRVVTVYDGQKKLGTTTADANGNWRFTTAPLSDAAHALTVRTQAPNGVAQTSTALTVTIDTKAPAAPKILSFSPDTGTVGDGVTNADSITLTGSAEANSTVRIFDGNTLIGTAKAAASGAWSFRTGELAAGAHAFTANATDIAGNVSAASTKTNVTIDRTPAVNLLVNGSFEESTVKSGTWAAFESVPGWHAIAGGTIELWNNLNGVKATSGNNFGELDYLGARDGFYQDVKTAAGQRYDLSFDARSRFVGSSSDIEVLWNGAVVATIPPGADWTTYRVTLTGTGKTDRLTFRELSAQSEDGLGALYDNIKLVKSTSAATMPSSTSVAADQALDLMAQYAAARRSAAGTDAAPLTPASSSANQTPTLTPPSDH